MTVLARILTLILLASSLLPALSSAQTVEEDKRETIESPADAPPEVPPEEKPQAAQRVIELTNEFRVAEGLQKVSENSQLTAAANQFALFMAEENKYGHTADGNRPSQRVKAQGYKYCIVSENIAYLYRSGGYETEALAQKFVTGWKESPEHRENMLDPDVTETGTAVVQSGTTGYYFAVQLFGRPKSQSIQYVIENQTEDTIHYESGNRKQTLPPQYRRKHELCRPSELKLFAEIEQSSEEEDSQQESLSVIASAKIENGVKFVVSKKSGKLQMRQEK